MVDEQRLKKLRTLITESIRIQRDTQTTVDYIDPGSLISDVCARQNHVVFGRRGCGKSLLLHFSARQLPTDARRVYLNCEDFKRHSFPNVLIEILEAVFAELDKNLRGWFGKKRRMKEIIGQIRTALRQLKDGPDVLEERVVQSAGSSASFSSGVEAGAAASSTPAVSAKFGAKHSSRATVEESQQLEFTRYKNKLEALDKMLPRTKTLLREFFELSGGVRAVYIQIDDFYHLRRQDQAQVIDYIHRLCKDLPLYFKLATLRHSSILFAEREEQPIGIQERHDYLPIDVDFTFEHFDRTQRQVRQIFYGFGELAGIEQEEIDLLFKGEGFTRLVVAGGGVPRDCLSLFLEAHDNAKQSDGRIGKDTMRLLSLQTFDNRINELKKDSKEDEQDNLLRGIYAIREFCLANKTNAFVVEERVLRDVGWIKELIYRLLDYRIIHLAASAFTHKTDVGTYRAFVIDAGCYAFMRKLEGKLNEIDVSDREAKEKFRSAPRLTEDTLRQFKDKAPGNVEASLREEVD